MLQRLFVLLYHGPWRLVQQSRLNTKPQPGLGIKRQLSGESLGDLGHVVEPGMLWIHMVSKEIVDSVRIKGSGGRRLSTR